MDVVVTGIGLRSALGNLAETWHSILLGQSGIQMYQPFPELPMRPLGLLSQQPAVGLQNLTQQVVNGAIVDAGLTLPLPDCAIVLGSSRGNQVVLERILDQRLEQRLSQDSTLNLSADPWLDCLPNVAAVVAARMIQSHAIVLAPMNACATGIWAIARGVELIRTGEYQQVLVGAVEAPITRLTLAGFEQMGALATTGAYPFDRQREGFVLGEGGAALVIESLASAQQRNAAKIYGKIIGFGLSADAYHLSSPQPQGKGAISAIQQSLQQAHLAATAIDFIHAHGTATKLNDATEATVIDSLFRHRPWVSSTKGATGHTLGASAALGAAFSLLALHHQVLPACAGLQDAEFDLNLVKESQIPPIGQTSIQYALVNALGFGGQNGAIVLQRYT